MSDDEYARARRQAMSPLLGAESFNPLSATVQVEFGASSRAGRTRDVNEDHYLIVHLERAQRTLLTSLRDSDVPEPFEEHGYAMMVADGLGQDGAGGIASRVALSTLAHLGLQFGRWNLRIDPQTAAEVVERVEQFYQRTSDAVNDESQRLPALTGMGTTLTAVFTAGDDLFYAHVGHSRLYLLRDGELLLLTRDQTLAQRLVDRPLAGPVEMAGQDIGHILTDVIGGRGRTQVDIEHLRLLDGDTLLLCTDGLTNVVDDERIAGIIAGSRRLQEQCEALVALAGREGTDDITVLMATFRIP